MDKRIEGFLRRHHVMSLSTISEQGSWTAHCFYAYISDHQALVFTTDPETRHGKEMLKDPNVSGGVMLETKVIGMIQGIQFTGHALPLTSTVTTENADADLIQKKYPVLASEARTAYLKRFPFALAAKLDLWVLYFDYIKMTDNRFGFGNKLTWQRNDEG